MNKFMQEAINEAFKGIQKGEGGPFGAVIVKNDKIISKAHNEVIKRNDPTCHAEMVAIRKACSKLKTFDLSDCEIYTSCEPCPMCFSAIHWAKIKTMYYGCTKDDAAKIDFDDKFIYDIIKEKSKDNIKTKQINRKECLQPFKEWQNMSNKIQY